MNNFTVYMHVFPNNKVYIGVTGRSVEERWGEKGEKYKTQFMKNAINKYGWHNIQHIILVTNLSEDWAYMIERYLILQYHSNDRKYGYNAASGGKINKDYKFIPHDKEAFCKKVSESITAWHKKPEIQEKFKTHGEAMRNRIISDETRRKMSESHKGKPSNRKGKTHTEESKRKMSESQKARHIVISDWQKQRVSEANKNKIVSEETRKKLSEANKGRHFTEEHRKKLSEAHKGKPSGRKGKHLSEETKEKLRQANLGKNKR